MSSAVIDGVRPEIMSLFVIIESPIVVVEWTVAVAMRSVWCSLLASNRRALLRSTSNSTFRSTYFKLPSLLSAMHSSPFTVAGMSSSTSSHHSPNLNSWGASSTSTLGDSLSQSRSHYQSGYLMVSPQTTGNSLRLSCFSLVNLSEQCMRLPVTNQVTSLM